jgi:hypothetical protein
MPKTLSKNMRPMTHELLGGIFRSSINCPSARSIIICKDSCFPDADIYEMTKITTEKRGHTNGINKNVGVATVVACIIVEGKRGVGNVPIHARIAAMSARGRMVVPGEIVKKGGSYVQGCPSQHKSFFKKVQCTHLHSPYSCQRKTQQPKTRLLPVILKKKPLTIEKP